MKWIFLILSMLIPTMAFAQAAAGPAYLDGILRWILANPTMSGTVAVVVEIVLRLIPSAKPLSLLVAIKYPIDGMVSIGQFVSGCLSTLINSLQAPPPPAPPAAK